MFKEKLSILVCKVWKPLETSVPVYSSLQVPAFQLHMSETAMRASQKDFEHAMNQVKQLKDPGNEVKLKLYALYKQVKCLRSFII